MALARRGLAQPLRAGRVDGQPPRIALLVWHRRCRYIEVAGSGEKLIGLPLNAAGVAPVRVG
jgi:hypothetical protein